MVGAGGFVTPADVAFAPYRNKNAESLEKKGLRARRSCIGLLIHPFRQNKTTTRLGGCFVLVGAGGFGPPKSLTTDLQSAPFGRSGTLPNMELVNGVEPSTC